MNFSPFSYWNQGAPSLPPLPSGLMVLLSSANYVEDSTSWTNLASSSATITSIPAGGFKKSRSGGVMLQTTLNANHIVQLTTGGTINNSFDIEFGFGTNTGAVSSDVYAIAVQNDGKVLVGHDGMRYNGEDVGYLTRLNTDGTIDTSFNPDSIVDGTVRAIAFLSDQRIVVGGVFTSKNITILNTDGSIDTEFSGITTGFNNEVYSIGVDSINRIIIGGAFSSYNGVTTTNLIRLNTVGTIESTYEFNGAVQAIAMQSDDKYVVGGLFTTYSGVSTNRIMRFNSNGARDTGFSIGTGFNGGVNTLDIQSDGKILVGGAFTQYQGSTRNRMVRLNSDGGYDSGFDLSTGFNSTVRSVKQDSNGKVYVGGQFTTFTGTTENRIIRLNSDGTFDSAFDAGNGFNELVRAIDLDSNNRPYVGGQFTSYNYTGSTTVDFFKILSDNVWDSEVAWTLVIDMLIPTQNIRDFWSKQSTSADGLSSRFTDGALYQVRAPGSLNLLGTTTARKNIQTVYTLTTNGTAPPSLQAQFYYDKTAAAQTITTNTGSTVNFDNTYDFVFGNSQTFSNESIEGVLKNFMIFNRELTIDEVGEVVDYCKGT